MQSFIRKRWLKLALPALVVLTAAAVLLLSATGFGIRCAFVRSLPVETLAEAELDGACAQARVSDIIGTFARMGRLTEAEAEAEGVEVDVESCYCMLRRDDGRYVAVFVGPKYLPQLDRLSGAIAELGADEVKNLDFGLIRGTVAPLEGDALRLFRAWADAALPGEHGTEAFYEENLLPYVLNADYYGRFPKGVTIALTAVALILFAVGLVPLIAGVAGAFDKNVRREAARVGKEELSREFSFSIKIAPTLYAGEEHLWFFGRYSADIMPISELIWVHPRSRRLEGGKLKWFLVARDKSGGERSALFGEAAAEQAGEATLAAMLPGICTGYDAEKLAEYKKSPAHFAAKYCAPEVK